MVYKDLKESMHDIKMPDEMKKRIIKNCYEHTKEDYVMKKTNKNFKRMLPLVAVLVLCLSVGAVVANHFRGFKDVTKGTAIVGTIYEEATDMIKLNAEAKDNLVVSANVAEYDKAPYLYIDVLNISKYKIVDAEGNIVAEGSAKSTSAFENGTVAFEISLDNVPSGTYKLVVNEFVGSAKAEQDLPIKGAWECDFIK